MFSFSTTRSILRALITKRSPYYVQFYITGRCNLMCRQCNIVETNSPVGEMNLDQIREVASSLKRAGAGIVLLTGGEPFLRDDLPQIVEAFCRLGMNVRLQTAGTRVATEDRLRACYDAGARDINVSLDSLDCATSDYINAVPGSGDSAILTIERISRIFRRRSAILSLGTVLSRFNYLEIPSIIEFARRIGWLVSVVPVHIAPISAPKGFCSYDEQFLFRSDEFGALGSAISAIIDAKRAGATVFDSEWFLRSSLSFLKTREVTWRHRGLCDSPNLYFAIRPNGDFTTCCDYSLANPPKVFDSEFSSNLRSGAIARRDDVLRIVRNCAGCHYGSYPEVTLSVRNWRVLFERARRVVLSGRGNLRRAEVQDDFASEVERIKAERSDIYPKRWLASDLSMAIDAWQARETRVAILEADRRKRAEQSRIRTTSRHTI